MFSARYKKIFQDLRAEKKRAILMIAAVTVSLTAIGAVLGAYSILTAEIRTNYMGTNPASAVIVVENGVDQSMLDLARKFPGVEVAEARDVIMARARIGRDWRPILIFVVDDYSQIRISLFTPEKGEWPAPKGTMLIERTAVSMLEADIGGMVQLRMPSGKTSLIKVSGLVHDPGLAPAWQERMGYGYIDRETLAILDPSVKLRELRILVSDRTDDIEHIEKISSELALALVAKGGRIHEIRVPPPHRHPHQSQMVTVLSMLLIFAVLSLFLSAILVAVTFSGMLARQVREIAVMKTLGATRWQVGGVYLIMVFILGLFSLIPALPLGTAGSFLFVGQIGKLLNLNISQNVVPFWVYGVQIVSGLFIPLLIAAVPVSKAARTTIRRSLDNYGVSGDRITKFTSRLPGVFKNLLRRPGRFALTTALLSAGGAMFMTALNMSKSWEQNLDKFYEARFYDAEFRLHQGSPPVVIGMFKDRGQIDKLESWKYFNAAPVTGQSPFDISRTYPDKGHASFTAFSVPWNTSLVRFPVLAGRWLQESDAGSVVLNHNAQSRIQAKIGETIQLSLEGVRSRWKVVGIVEEIGAPPAVYMDDRMMPISIAEEGAQMLRIASSIGGNDKPALIRMVEAILEENNVSVERGIPIAEHRTAVSDHIKILIRALIAMAVVMAIVGMLGLASTTGISVIERTKEIGVMKTIGAGEARIVRMVMGEAATTGLFSWCLGFLLSLPLSMYLDYLIGSMGFLASLPFTVDAGGVALWLAISTLVALLASFFPAISASRLVIREALAYV